MAKPRLRRGLISLAASEAVFVLPLGLGIEAVGIVRARPAAGLGLLAATIAMTVVLLAFFTLYAMSILGGGLEVDQVDRVIRVGPAPWFRRSMSFDEVERQTLRSGPLVGPYLAGPQMTPMGLVDKKARFDLALQGRVGDTPHPLADQLPGPLKGLGRHVVAVPEAGWRDALRLVLLIDLKRWWTC